MGQTSRQPSSSSDHDAPGSRRPACPGNSSLTLRIVLINGQAETRRTVYCAHVCIVKGAKSTPEPSFVNRTELIEQHLGRLRQASGASRHQDFERILPSRP
jgi:hypothetical protein